MKKLRVKDIEKYLFSKFPKTDAEKWDQDGLLVGKPGAVVEGIACALNATPETVEVAQKEGCNVLVTHHPAYIKKPSISAIKSGDILENGLSAATVSAALKNDVSLINMHTNMDVSSDALHVPSKLTGFRFSKRLIEPSARAFSGKGILRGSYGCILSTATKSVPVIARTFGKAYDTTVAILSKKRPKTPRRIAFCSGTLDAEIAVRALEKNVNVLVCGEIHYHDTLALCDAGASILCLGHDASEKPYAELLKNLLKREFKGVKTTVIEEKDLLLEIK